MKALELKIPPALLMVLAGGLMWVLDHYLPQFKQAWYWHEWAARGVFVLALMPLVAGAISFRKAQTTVDPTRPDKATSVVTGGMYRFTRNPMYLGFLLMLLAFVLKLSNPLTSVMLPLFIMYMNQFQIKPEERALTELFGAEYLAYKERVRRWL